eukprot:1599455-Pleurochrysis_carterae.AAC.1
MACEESTRNVQRAWKSPWKSLAGTSGTEVRRSQEGKAEARNRKAERYETTGGEAGMEMGAKAGRARRRLGRVREDSW